MEIMHRLILLTLLLSQTAASNITFPNPNCNRITRFLNDLITNQRLTRNIVLIGKDQLDLDVPDYTFTHLSSDLIDNVMISSVHKSMVNGNTRALYVINDADLRSDETKQIILKIRSFNKYDPIIILTIILQHIFHFETWNFRL